MTRGLISPQDVGTLNPFLEEAEPPRSYPRGSRLITQDEPALGVYILTEGLVKVHRLCADGQGAIIGLRPAGWLLGAPGVLLGQPYGGTVTALTACSVARLAADRFLRLVQSNMEVSSLVHRMLARTVDNHVKRLESLSCHSARQRLEEFFDELRSFWPGTERGIEVPLRDREIAQLVAVTPPYLSKLLREMIGSGMVRRERGVLLVQN